MIFTARQLEDLHRSNGSNGHVVLPYRARLSPLAQDWIRARRIVLGYSDVDANSSQASGDAQVKMAGGSAPPDSRSPGAILWWCDGPCGPAKAALLAQTKESNLRPLALPADARKLSEAIKSMALEVKTGQASAGILALRSAAAAVVLANRCPSLRAIVGTCLDAVEEGLGEVAANVLIIEHPHKTLPQMKSLLGRFVRASRQPSEMLRRQLQELSSCA